MAETHQFEATRLEFDDGITTLTLDRPEKKNAISPTMIEEFAGEIKPRLQDSVRADETSVLVVTGAGDAFCGGMDLEKYFLANADDPQEKERLAELNKEWFTYLYEFPRATLGSVNGWCFGGGLGLLCTLDLALADRAATLGLSEVRWGILPGGGATYLPALTVQRRDFLEMSLMGREIDGERAADMRLVNRAVDGEDLAAETRAWAEELNALHPTVVGFAKQAYYAEIEASMDYDTAWDYESARNDKLRTRTRSEDVKALQAFADRKFKPGLETYTDEDIEEYGED